MRKENKKYPDFVAKELPEAEKERLLCLIGMLLKDMRNNRASIKKFSYQVSISHSQISRYEGGGDIRLSTFLKVLYGLDITPQEFFEMLKKQQSS